MPETPARILIVDDDEAHAEVAAEVLDRAGRGFECVSVHSGEAAQRTLLGGQSFDVVLLDLKLPDIDGMKLLELLRQRHPDTEVIIMTGYGSVTHAVEALQKGAFSFLEKPLQRDHLRNQVAKALERRRLATDNRELRALIDEKFGLGGLLGSSPPMRAIFDRIRQVAPTDARVLITGPNGSGKELVARAIHFNSKRAGGRLVAFNCGAISGDLLQSELFGHVRGAFTGADRHREGKFEYASGGTLFLDEIGEMPLEAQVKLLRVLETREVTRVGANDSIPVDVRLISATNKNLEEEVKAGRFREDLYYRLKVIQIEVPPLRERGGDIVLLAESFMREFATQYGKQIVGLTRDVSDALLAHTWPGNVRELRNTVEEMVVLCDANRLGAEQLPPTLRRLVRNAPSSDPSVPAPIDARAPIEATGAPADPYSFLVGQSMDQVERNMIRVTLAANDGNRERTAEQLGIGERTLYRKIKEYGLDS